MTSRSAIRACWMLAMLAATVMASITAMTAAAIDDTADWRVQRGFEERSPIHGVARISDRLVNLLVQRYVTRQQYLQEYVLGTRTSGPVVLQGLVSAELVPGTDSAALDIRLVGTTECLNHIGKRGPVTISSSAAGQIDARKRVVIADSGIQALPTAASCTAQVKINDIIAQNRVVERIAWRRAKRMHSEIEQAAAEMSGTRTEQQLDEELNAPLAEADKVLSEKFGSTWSKQVGEFPVRFALSSTEQFLQAVLTAADGFQVPPPPALHAKWDVFVGLHQSCFDRLFQATLADKTIADATLLDVMQIATGNAPRPLWVHDRTERWSVVMAKEQPVTGVFADDHCSITVRLQQVKRGNQQLDRALEVVAKYKLEMTPDGPHLIRQGELSVRFTPAAASTENAATEQEESFRKFVHSKLSGVFQPDIFFDGLVPPAGGSLGKLRSLELRELSCRDGWFSIGYLLPSNAGEEAKIAQLTDKK